MSPGLQVADALLSGTVQAMRRSADALLNQQHESGFWWAELQSNVSITAEVVLLHHVWGTFARVPRAAASARSSEFGRKLKPWAYSCE